MSVHVHVALQPSNDMYSIYEPSIIDGDRGSYIHYFDS